MDKNNNSATILTERQRFWLGHFRACEVEGGQSRDYAKRGWAGIRAKLARNRPMHIELLKKISFKNHRFYFTFKIQRIVSETVDMLRPVRSQTRDETSADFSLKC